jgi:hypothetical protein
MLNEEARTAGRVYDPSAWGLGETELFLTAPLGHCIDVDGRILLKRILKK